MGAIHKNYSQHEAIELAINAGVDIVFYLNLPKYKENLAVKVIENIKALLEEGRISHKRIDQSFRRILKLQNCN